MSQSVGVAVKAMIECDGKFLVLKRSKNDDYLPDQIDIPGGRLEYGEDPETGLKREVMEETGLAIDIVRPLSTWTFKRQELQIIGITFLCRSYDKNVRLSGEHSVFEWVELSDIVNPPEWLVREIKLVQQ